MRFLRLRPPAFTHCGVACCVLAFYLAVPTAVDLLSAEPLPHCTAGDRGFDAAHLNRIDGLVAEQIEKKQLPGCVVMIGRRGTVAFAKAYGNRSLEPAQEKMTLDTVFDMASLTKPVATATSIMLLVERGKVRLRDPVMEYLPEFSPHGKDKITIEDLLTHQGGLIPDNPLSDYQHGVDEAWRRIWALQLASPVGEKFVYTDVGFQVLGEVVRRVTGQNVAEFSAENIFRPLQMSATGYLPNEALRARAATTEKRDGEWLRGVVHDPRAALLAGVAGHAGLFSTADDMAVYANMMLSQGKVGPAQILSPLTVDEMTRPRDIAGQKRGLGWDIGSKYSSNRGELFSPQAFGHGGFTGTAMWIDPALDLFVIFLSNRVHPDGQGSVNRLAGAIGTIAAAAIIGTPLPPASCDALRADSPAANVPSAKVLLGIDVLQRDSFTALAGSRVGLITNHTGSNGQGQRTIDLLHEAGNVTLVALFSPEHGLQGQLDQSRIDDTRDEATGLPTYSLYGKSRQPQLEHLQDIDTLVFDIQDIGTRFYTYLSTMGMAMETAAQQGLRFVVLDRPNPIGGELVEGPVLDAGSESFVGYHPIPVRHGMTLGELATLIRHERQLDLNIEIIQVENWRREEYWDATGLTWINPSPNMRSLAQAVLYPGIGLLETTNLSVGRGTDTPFEVIGAPWINGQQLAAELNRLSLPGARFVPIRFTPAASKYADRLCQGVNIVVVNRHLFRPVEVGLQIASTLRKRYQSEWETGGLNRLLSNRAVFDAIVAGIDADKLPGLYRKQLDQFVERRQAFLLYPK